MFSTKPSLGLKGHGLKKKKNQVGGFFTTVLLLLKGLFQKIMWSKSQREHKKVGMRLEILFMSYVKIIKQS